MNTKQSEITPEMLVDSIKQVPLETKAGGIVGIIRRAITAVVLEAESRHNCKPPFWMVVTDQAEEQPAYTLYVDEQRRLYGETPKSFCYPAQVVVERANGERFIVMAYHQQLN